MPAKDLRFNLHDADGGVKRIEFLDRNILDEANIAQIGSQISAIIEAEHDPRILIDFTHVEHLSSAALATLIRVNNEVHAKSGQLRLSNIDPQIYEVFVITRLNKHFQIHDTNEEAMKSFK